MVTTPPPPPLPPPPPNDNTPTPPLSTVTTKQTPTSTLPSSVIIIPTHSRWFSWNKIHECEVKFLPEFFEGRSLSKNPRVYKYYRNAIIGRFRENPNRKVSFTEVRKTIIGDVGSVRRIFDFLESWGLVNYFGSPFTNKQLNQQKWEDKESNSNSKGSGGGGGAAGSAVAVSDGNIVEKRKLCSACKLVCSVACFTCDKDDVTLCARCFVRGNYKVGVTSSDFKRVEISDEVKKDWTDKETLHLLEAVMHYRDDWKRVAEHVGGRTARECVAQFVKLPFGEQFIGPPDSSLVDDTIRQPDGQSNNELTLRSTMVPLSKRMRLTPLADASNPIMAQAAFLSALVGVDVAQAAAHAAFVSLYEGYNCTGKKESRGRTKQQESVVSSNGNTTTTNALEEAQLQVEREEDGIEQAISSIIDVQMNEIQEKIVRFEEFDLQVEKKSEQLEQMKNLLFVDQLNLLFHKYAEPKSRESMEKVLKAEGEIS